MTKKLSYLLIGDPVGHEFANDNKTLKLSGLYLWKEAFKQNGKSGEINTFWRREDLENYDIVHINYTPSNISLPTVVRNELGKDSDTKLVINVDLDVSHWSASWAYHINELMRELPLADKIFHVEPVGTKTLSHLLNTKIDTLPHPVDVTNLYDYIQPVREEVIGSIFHRYTGETTTHYISQKNIPLRRYLFGYTPISKQPMVANAGMYDQIFMQKGFTEHIEEFSTIKIGCDLYSGYTFGRAVVEMAALGIPAVVSNTIAAANYLFPDTTVSPFDTEGAEKLFKKLYEDMDFANTVIKQAHDLCGWYNLRNSYDRFVNMCQEDTSA